jgi:hypothetical protein
MNLEERSKYRRMLAGSLSYGAVSTDTDVVAVAASAAGSK